MTEHRTGQWSQSEAGDIDIPARDWASFLDSFSHQHQRWLATISGVSGNQQLTPTVNCRLKEVTAKSTDTAPEIRITMDCGDGNRIERTFNPVRLIFKRDASGAHEGLDIVASDSSVTSLRFRVAVRPESLDGVLTPVNDNRIDNSFSTPLSRYTTATEVQIPAGEVTLAGNMAVPESARGIVLFAHGSGSSRHSPRNRYVAQELQKAGVATLLMDLLTPAEEAVDDQTAELRFDIGFLAARLTQATRWVLEQEQTRLLRVGYFGASTGAAAALVAAAELPGFIAAVVSRGGRPDLAGDALLQVVAPTLLIVGGRDLQVLELNQRALNFLRGAKELVVVPGASHLFEEPGALETVARIARDWFVRYLHQTRDSVQAA